MTTIYDLPMPEPADLERSSQLTSQIRHDIDLGGGFIPFARYMDLALYHPELGYYNSASFTLGSEGDFTTAPEISPVFARSIARYFCTALKPLDRGSILELGAGTGRFAGDALTALQELGCMPEHYFIYEPNIRLRQKQQRFIADHYPHQHILWLDTLPAGFKGVIFANEVLDALPIHCFTVGGNVIHERGVSWDNGQFSWCARPPSLAELTAEVKAIQSLHPLPSGYRSEINLSIPAILRTVADCLTEGSILFIDYGYGRSEYYHPDRREGTLTCFYKHRRHADPFILPGLQDITAHVDFTYLAEKSIENGLTLAGYTTQAGFLLDNGLADIISTTEVSLNAANAFKLHQAAKILTMPTEMGERIKVMALSKQFDTPLPGFKLQDRRRDL